jgi:hypothetical protein
VLHFPADSFFAEDFEKPCAEAASFRSLSRMTAGQRKSITAHEMSWFKILARGQPREDKFVLSLRVKTLGKKDDV